MLTVAFELAGQPFTALNGGPNFAVSRIMGMKKIDIAALQRAFEGGGRNITARIGRMPDYDLRFGQTEASGEIERSEMLFPKLAATRTVLFRHGGAVGKRSNRLLLPNEFCPSGGSVRPPIK